MVPQKYGALARIYEKELLERTSDVLKNGMIFNTIKDTRRLIDEVYDVPVSGSDISSEIKAGRNILSRPTERVSSIITKNHEQYDAFRNKEAQTREESYPTVQLALIAEDERTDGSFDNIRNIFLNKIVSVPKGKVKSFESVETDVSLLADIFLIEGEDGVAESDEMKIELTEDGLRCRKKTNT